MKKSLIAIVFAGIASLLVLTGCATGQTPDIHTVDISDVDGDIFIHSIGRSYLNEQRYIQVSLNWDGDGTVMFLSSSLELCDEVILELIEDGTLLFHHAFGGLASAGARRTINGEEVLLGRASSSNEIRWGLYGIKDGGVGGYGYRYFYVLTKDAEGGGRGLGNHILIDEPIFADIQAIFDEFSTNPS